MLWAGGEAFLPHTSCTSPVNLSKSMLWPLASALARPYVTKKNLRYASHLRGAGEWDMTVLVCDPGLNRQHHPRIVTRVYRGCLGACRRMNRCVASKMVERSVTAVRLLLGTGHVAALHFDQTGSRNPKGECILFSLKCAVS